MDNTKRLILYFVKYFPRMLYRTELVKLIYLFEYYYYQAHKRQFTSVTFKRDKNGPYTVEIQKALAEIEEDGRVKCVTKRNFWSGNATYRYYVDANSRVDNPEAMLDDEKITADYIIELTRGLRLKQILRMVYDTPPMSNILSDERSSVGEQIGRYINMNDVPGSYKTTRKCLLAAKARVLARPQKGTDEEYSRILANKYAEYKDLRRRATACLK